MAFDSRGMDTPIEDLITLAGLASRIHASRIAEIGSFAGRTARCLSDSGATVYCVDTWAGKITDAEGEEINTTDGVFEAFLSNCRDRLHKTILPLVGESVVWAKTFDDHSLDMVFIDGDHSYESVKADIAAWKPKVRPGGILCGHDYGVFPGVIQAVEEEGGCYGCGRTIWFKFV